MVSCTKVRTKRDMLSPPREITSTIQAGPWIQRRWMSPKGPEFESLKSVREDTASWTREGRYWAESWACQRGKRTRRVSSLSWSLAHALIGDDLTMMT